VLTASIPRSVVVTHIQSLYIQTPCTVIYSILEMSYNTILILQLDNGAQTSRETPGKLLGYNNNNKSFSPKQVEVG
jgi:hypothetical protein